MSNQPGDRRAFIRGAAITLGAASYSRVMGANDRIGIGMIGYGLIAKNHVSTFLKLPNVDIVGVAECHQQRLDEGLKAAGDRATGHRDFRKLLDDKSVHGVVVATPDHWHALMTMMACAAGKDVYVEKPLTRFVREGEWVQAVANRHRRVVQVGTQQRSGQHYQRARELVRSGHLGTISSVRIKSVRNIFPGFGNPADADPPAALDWDMWLGPAPARKYNPLRALYHFRWFWDTAGGQMTNLVSHQLDIIDWVLGLDGMRTVSSIGGRYAIRDGGETPDTQDALIDCKSFSISIGLREAAHGEKLTYGLTFHGTRGSLGIDRKGLTIVADPEVPPINLVPGVKSGHPAGGPLPIFMADDPLPRTKPAVDNSGDSATQYLAHAQNFIDCIKSRAVPISDLASGHRSATACHLANLSLRLGRSLRWNDSKGEITDDKQANELLTLGYRAPWDRELKALGVTNT